VGAGVGTGRGSATGAGTGGGTQANYPPVPVEFFLPPLPPPSSVRGLHFIAEFDVDSTGRVIGFDFTPTRDGDYNKRIAQVLRQMKFRPGTRPDGSPLRMKAQVGYEF
jgi:periplasmic protein TonB